MFMAGAQHGVTFALKINKSKTKTCPGWARNSDNSPQVIEVSFLFNIAASWRFLV